MGDGEGMNFDVADGEAVAGVNGFDAAEAFAELIGQDAVESFESGLGDKERRLPGGKDLGEAVAVIGVLVGDEYAVERFEVDADGSEAGEGFAFAEAGVNEEAGALGLEQGDVARASGRENRDAQADRYPQIVLRMMAEGGDGVNEE